MHNIHFSIAETTILIIGIFIAIGSFIFEVRRRIWIILKGVGEFQLDNIGKRLWRVFKEVFLHEKVIKDRLWPGLMHAFVFWGFVVFGIITLNHFSLGFNYQLISHTYLKFYSYIVIPFSFLVLFGISFLTWRRFVTRPVALGKVSYTSGLVAISIVLLMVTYLLGEIHLSPLAWKVNWWIHRGRRA